MLDPITLSILCLGAALGLLILETLIPSSGIISAVAALMAFMSIFYGMRHSYQFGLWLLIAELASVPVLFWLFVTFWERTPMARRVAVEAPEIEPFTWSTAGLVGRTGIAACEFLPSGEIEIEGQRYEALCRDGYVKPGTKLKVIAEEMGDLIVIPFNDKLTSHVASTDRPDATSSNSKSLVDMPANEIGIDSID